MNKARCVIGAALLMAACSATRADTSCPTSEVEAHVREQFAIHGPLSSHHEYFGFIYRSDGEIRSAIVKSGKCTASGACQVDSAIAAAKIPPGAKILGEWHTHPHNGSVGLSIDDVRGALHNSRIRCYRPYYSRPTGEIYSWDPTQSSFGTAMSTRAYVGDYVRDPAPEVMTADVAAPAANST